MALLLTTLFQPYLPQLHTNSSKNYSRAAYVGDVGEVLCNVDKIFQQSNTILLATFMGKVLPRKIMNVRELLVSIVRGTTTFLSRANLQ